MTDRASVATFGSGADLGADATGFASAGDYLALLKPRVMSLVVFTGLAGLVAAPGSVHPVIAFTGLLCIALGAGAAGALNMWYDADIDCGMERTRSRPIPAGRIAPGSALGFGATLSVAAVVLMGLAVNLVSAALLAVTIGFYLFVYTMWLKRRTPQNIVIGGAAGALPPVIGWSVVTGGVSLEPLVLFAIIFMWTPPHFWALALKRSDEYARVGVPMLPVVAGPDATRRHILIYSVLLVPLTALPWIMGFAGAVYGWLAIVLGAAFLFGAIQVWAVRQEPAASQWATRLFGYSILYLFLLFAALLLEHAFGAGA